MMAESIGEIGQDLWSEINVDNNWVANAVEEVTAETEAADGDDLNFITEDEMAYIEEDLGGNLIQEAVPQSNSAIVEAFAALQNLGDIY